jgi:hypothetical protein
VSANETDLTDLFAELLAESDEQRVSFLKNELALGLTFSIRAATNYEAGNLTSAERSMSEAEEAYATVSRFLSDPKHSKRLTEEQARDITAELERLRDRLDGLRAKPT